MAFVQYSKNLEVNILHNKDGVILGKAKVLDAQPLIPPGWNDPNTALCDYVLMSCDSVVTTKAAKNCVVEQEGWKNYLRKDWTLFTKEPDQDDESGEGDGWEMLLMDIADEDEDFLVYREVLALKPPRKKSKHKAKDSKSGGPKNDKPSVSTSSTDVLKGQNHRARDNREMGALKNIEPRPRTGIAESVA